MKLKTVFLTLLGFLFVFQAAGQEAKLFSVHARHFLADANPFRYSPVGAIDEDRTSVFAVAGDDLLGWVPLFSLDFSGPTELDGLRLQGCYFDSRYFLKNNRIKTLTVKVRAPDGKTEVVEKAFTLQDKMEDQDFSFGRRVTASGIDVYATEVYPGSTWNDTVVSDFRLLLGGRPLVYRFDHNPKDSDGAFVSTQEGTEITYDSDKRRIAETEDFHKMGYNTVYSSYSPEGVLVFRLHRLVDPENTTDRFELFFSAPDAQHPEKSLIFNADGSPDGKATFTYSGYKLVKEVRTGTHPATNTWTYTSDLLQSKEVRAHNLDGDAYTELFEYFYKGALPVGERVTSENASSKTVSLYQYIYVDQKVRFKIPVLDTRESLFYSQELIYDGDLLVSTVSSMHSVF
ncbi:MAG: hypothetical protein JZU49_03880 [Sulfuricurvum sp.]|nr:hypothetical protein [Sulfuricurvum sp.]